MFKVVYQNSEQEFERWTEALDYAKALIPNCKSLFADIRIYHEKELIWIYSRSHKYPQYIGAGTYDRLARLFILETMEEEEEKRR
ncbi:hypothetical protein Sta7437_4319 [Stanieria cyanosphaera PCC 7437]|uniref:PH domain-containing protein n=1 Tax=Stanieria cyanosphaera (strain ATCC 29371 / PCC 7437) TaxID=111780 RepID=K9XZ44_STAC7|nr:hypothetical protein [Stanieria cyanosphaera]AFZ37788.1 hypothetical protein Sta7437_4319 [Stanieria cyanosphaera PCC 7437]